MTKERIMAERVAEGLQSDVIIRTFAPFLTHSHIKLLISVLGGGLCVTTICVFVCVFSDG